MHALAECGSVELIDIDTEEQIWAETYKGKLADVFDIQEQVNLQENELDHAPQRFVLQHYKRLPDNLSDCAKLPLTGRRSTK